STRTTSAAAAGGGRGRGCGWGSRRWAWRQSSASASGWGGGGPRRQVCNLPAFPAGYNPAATGRNPAMDRSNHYEAAFEAWLQEQRLCYVAVDETRRCVLGDGPVKNLDFVVYGPAGARLVVDVKGRRFPGGRGGRKRRVRESRSA